MSRELKNRLKEFYPNTSSAGKPPITKKPTCQLKRQGMAVERACRLANTSDPSELLEEWLAPLKKWGPPTPKVEFRDNTAGVNDQAEAEGDNPSTPVEETPLTGSGSREGQWQSYTFMRSRWLNRLPPRHA